MSTLTTTAINATIGIITTKSMKILEYYHPRQMSLTDSCLGFPPLVRTLILLLKQLPTPRASRWPDKEDMNYNQRGRLQVEKRRPDDVLAVTQPWSITSKNCAEAQRQMAGFLAVLSPSYYPKGNTRTMAKKMETLYSWRTSGRREYQRENQIDVSHI